MWSSSIAVPPCHNPPAAGARTTIPVAAHRARARSPWCTRILALLLTGLTTGMTLAGCGFQLRGTRHLAFSTIALKVPPNSPFGIELARSIRFGTDTRVVPEGPKAQAVFSLLGNSKDKEVLTMDAQGNAIQYTLTDTLRFRLLDAKGHELIEPTTIAIQRVMSSSDTQTISKETEDALLYRDMRSDLVQQVLDRIAAVKRHADPH